VDGFSWGEGGLGQETPGHVHHGRFSLDDKSFQTAPFLCYILYIEQWGFTTSCFGPLWRQHGLEDYRTDIPVACTPKPVCVEHD
jgi:hypothetical protein